MSYLNFDKSHLCNLEFGLRREVIRASETGSFASTTIVGCNTRKYHGLLISPQPGVDGGKHVLLSTVDETVIQNDAHFNFGIHRYPGNIFNPKGHKYIREFSGEPIPRLIFRVGGVLLSKEMLFSSKHDRVMIRYTLLEANSLTVLRLKPFLAFRNMHALTKANIHADTSYTGVANGMKMCLYPGYSPLYMQCSEEVEYVHVPHWYNNIEYLEELERGYDCQEDLLVPGFFELPLPKGGSVIFSAGLEEAVPGALKRSFNDEFRDRIPRSNFVNCLLNSAEQFIVRSNGRAEVIAGYPWFGSWGRDTFIALPGLTLARGDAKTCREVMDTMLADLKGPLFPNISNGSQSAYNSVDASLWFFWALQQYAAHTNTKAQIWQEYGDKMKLILNGYRRGTDYNIRMLGNGLISGGGPGLALTWMDAIVNGNPVTPRTGMAVEINALWYNAVVFSLEVALLAGDIEFVDEWEKVAALIREHFKPAFWHKDKGYLADYVDGDYRDWSVRPNQIFAVSLPHSPLSEQIKKLIVDICERELLTDRGLRTLSPAHPDYKGMYAGNIAQRDGAYHQGTVWPWLMGHFSEAYLKIHGQGGLTRIRRLYEGMEETMSEHGIGSISEVYDGDPPHKAGGAPSQAWSVAEVLRMKMLIEQYST
jgi:predicted glycogen debranching enzyme